MKGSILSMLILVLVAIYYVLVEDAAVIEFMVISDDCQRNIMASFDTIVERSRVANFFFFFAKQWQDLILQVFATTSYKNRNFVLTS